MNIENKALLDKVMTLEGKDLTHLTEEEKKVFDSFKAHEHEFGIRLDVVTEAPISELEQGTSSYLTNELVQRYPKQIIVIKE